MSINSCLTCPLFLFWFFLFLVCFSPGSSVEQIGSECLQREREALLAIKKGLTDSSGRLSSWVGEDCCKWEGIGCSKEKGNVIKLDLRNPYQLINGGVGDASAYKRSCFGGKIDPSLLHLEYLSYLDLSMNDFEGLKIPEFLGELKYMQYLNLSFASFSGMIPPQLGNLTRLQFFDLNADSFSNSGTWELRAENLHWVSGLRSLKYLNLNFVKLDDVGVDWLQAINRLPSLVELHLHWCKLPSPAPIPLSLNFTMLSVLDLSENSFGSSMPSWLFNLTSLTKLYLRWNFFKGPIPSELENLKSLEVLDLASNLYLEGQIPGLFGRLSKLKILDFSGNNFNGEIQEFMDSYSGTDSSLELLDLSSNNLVGKLPESIGILKRLKYLLLSGNSFSGSIPTSIGNLVSMEKLDLSSNLMNETIPEGFGKLSELVEVNLILNSWEGVLREAHLRNLRRLEILRLTTDRTVTIKVSSQWLPPFKLKNLQLENCQVGPAFPRWLQSQTELSSVTLKDAGISAIVPEEWFSKLSLGIISLDLSKNHIIGKLPNKLRFPNLNFVDLSFNHFEGPLPQWSMNATTLYLHNNSFSGSIPEDIVNLMPRLQKLYLFGNHLSGRIPSSLCNAAELQILSLRGNQFSGELPDCWHNNSWTLWALDLSSNRLSGNIPNSIGNLPSLAILMLRDNNLNGEIPSSLQNRSGLTSVDFGRNKLSGNLPTWIGEQFSSLFMLRLDSNLFIGHIPETFCNLHNLHILDLSQNKLSGIIPKCLQNLTEFVHGNNSEVFENQIRIVKRDSTLSFVNSIDLSGNNLTKEIPDEITSLAALEVLNLSRNHLSGSIPEKIGNLHRLMKLDLSHNNLSGQIPKSLVSSTSLMHLNVSHNNLAGKIPPGFQKFNDQSIYEGNALLCGDPLPRKCRGEHKFSTVA